MSLSRELRCFCAQRPLLAKWGTGSDGKPYLHQKAWKARRIIAESIVVLTPGSVVKLRCRECGRWHRIAAVSQAVRLEETTPPTGADAAA